MLAFPTAYRINCARALTLPCQRLQRYQCNNGAAADRFQLLVVEANKSSKQSGQDRSTGLDPSLEAPVPSDQRPVNELLQLKDSPMCSWAVKPFPEYLSRLSAVFLGAVILLGGPVSAQTFEPADEPLAFAAASVVGGLIVAGGVTTRLYLAWKYVGDRLLTASLPYEETGWYDGQVFIKPPEVLMRDRLLGMYEVKPALSRLLRTLQLTGAGLAGLVLALVISHQGTTVGVQDATGRRIPAQVTPYGIIYSDRVGTLADLAGDDEAAEAEALAQGGMPGYCGDRYLRAAAGGQYCKKFDAK